MFVMPTKDPNEVLDYMVDWSARLDGDTILSSDFIAVDADSGVTIGAKTKTDNTATVWLSGGIEGGRCVVTNRIVTVGGRTMDESLQVSIKSN